MNINIHLQNKQVKYSTVSITEQVWVVSWLEESTNFSSALEPSSTLLYFNL